MIARIVRSPGASRLALLALAFHLLLPLVAQAQTDVRLLLAAEWCGAGGERAATPFTPDSGAPATAASCHAGHCLLCFGGGERPVIAGPVAPPAQAAGASIFTRRTRAEAPPGACAHHRPSQPRAPPRAA